MVAKWACGSTLVPEAGVEPACPCERGILSPLRLPFRHSGETSARIPETLYALSVRGASGPSRMSEGAARFTTAFVRPRRGGSWVLPLREMPVVPLDGERGGIAGPHLELAKGPTLGGPGLESRLERPSDRVGRDPHPIRIERESLASGLQVGLLDGSIRNRSAECVRSRPWRTSPPAPVRTARNGIGAHRSRSPERSARHRRPAGVPRRLRRSPAGQSG